MNDTGLTPTTPRRRVRPLALGATALLVGAAAVAATGIAFATGTGSATPGRAPSAAATEDPDGTTVRDRLRQRFGGMGGVHHGPGGMGGAGMGRGMGGGPIGMGGGIRGEFVVPDGDGGYRSMLTQTGEVTAVSSTSITVRSEDGYSHTYLVEESTVVNTGRDGIGDVAVGDQVHLVAAREGGADKAVHVADLTTMRESARRWGYGPAPRDGGATVSGWST